MLEYRHVTVDVPYRARILLHRDLAVDLGHSSRKYWQLQLRHPSLLNPLLSTPQIHLWLILFSPIVRNYWARSGDVKVLAVHRFPPSAGVCAFVAGAGNIKMVTVKPANKTTLLDETLRRIEP